MRYTINGETFANASEVIETFGAGDYTARDWREIARDGFENVRRENVAVFPDLSAFDQDELASATMAYAQEMLTS